METSDEKEPVLCQACQRRFSLIKAIPKLTPLQRGLLIKIEASPGGAPCLELYPLLPFARRPAQALKVHITRLRKILNPLGMDIDINKTEYRQSDQSRYQLVRWSDRNAV